MLIFTRNVQADQNRKLKSFHSNIIDISKWKQVDELISIQIEIAQFLDFS